ncbi:MAG: cytochrome C biogenesis protein [Planctomycetaceae bacterium TMED240]|nr:cytochrome C biogenesis protein [Rhodopirellula sp.]OUX05392.1 MAG: cytochrome C biogenesis protein [Planctomycetaceae bacterium TMED240]
MSTIVDSARGPKEKAGNLSLLGIFSAIGSLKFTVVLFALSLVTVLVGTLAQDEMNMFEVKQRYFTCWFTQLYFDDLLPQAFYPHDEPISGRIPFPGGALIGALLMINLVAAKATRFRVSGKGSRLAFGIGLIALGSLLAFFVVAAGHSSEGLQGTPPISYEALWASVLASLTVMLFGFVYAGAVVSQRTIKTLAFCFAGLLAVFVTYALVKDFRIGDPGLRIVWQLAKGMGAGIILLAGCVLVFGKQGGNVLLHLGVGLLMFGQFAFGDRQLEQRLSLIEGESSNTLVNLDLVELDLIAKGKERDEVIAIPGSRLRAAVETGEVISDEALPVDVRVVAFYENSNLAKVEGENFATTGFGLETEAVRSRKSGGTDSDLNLASAYVDLIDKQTGDSLGVHLVSQLLSDRVMLLGDGKSEDRYDSVTINNTSYEIGLKFHREVKPYWVQLVDVRRVNYSGTDTPRDYSSFIRIVDEATGEDRRERVWMNNPLRYRGETFYQSSYTPLPSGKERTGIQVVQNSGWLIPYLACSITALGMLAHFFGTLTRFLKRRERETRQHKTETAEGDHANSGGPSMWPVFASVAGFAILAVFMLVPKTALRDEMSPTERVTKFDFYAAGKIAAQFGGRVMPLDAYARQTVKAISSKESIPLEGAPIELKDRVDGEKLSAMQWLMEVASNSKEIEELRMFRIDAEEVRSEFGLPRRKSKLYSLTEIRGEWGRVSRMVDEAMAKDGADQSFKERKLLELDRRTRQYTVAAAAFQFPSPRVMSEEEFQRFRPGQPSDSASRAMFAMRELAGKMEQLKKMPAAAVIPPDAEVASETVDQPKWTAFSAAFFDEIERLARAGEESDVERSKSIASFGDMISAYSDEDTELFNQAVDQHAVELSSYPIIGFSPGLVSLERWMQASWPTGVAMFLYLVTLVLGLVYFAVNLPRLRQAVWGMLVIALVVHTIAITCRIAITGRAPVINIYSSAVFIGWAAVLFGVLVERIFRYGVGNLLASAAGALTLLVAYGLNTGDTMPVLQAVLDTQFWLATHVITVSLGYVATLVAGTLGAGYLLAGWVGVEKTKLRDVYRCIYGATCFGILFSFVGTVLGGLWADDSWGRFWGWDPKENGALLIVIWNALMLHARWDGMVSGRGFAVLAIGGNVVTAWSWFGTNELGIGMHSYGFTSGVLMWLSIYILMQLAFVCADLVMRSLKVRFGSDASPS